MITPLPLLPLFQKFINHTHSGKRRNKNGSRIKPRSVLNYNNCFKLLQQFAASANEMLMIYQVKGNNKKEHHRLKKYYNNFYKNFTDYLYHDKKCYDNYVGQNIKQVRSFFVWLNQEMAIQTGLYYQSMYVFKEEISILTLSVEQLHFLIHNKDFENNLQSNLVRTKDIFVLGCIVGLRFSDLLNIKTSNLLLQDSNIYLQMRSQKTGTDTMVKLPEPAIAIIQKYRAKRTHIFSGISLNQFNKNIKAIALKAGWTQPVQILRSRRGILIPASGRIKGSRFCDKISSHTMRRTSITTMLTAGMPEHVVRKISGHTHNSKAFFRYVNLAQSLMDKEIEKLHRQL